MKQLKHWLLALLIIPALAIGFTACGGDDEDDDEPTSSNSLVGYWLRHHSDVYDGFYFASDGSGWEFEYVPSLGNPPYGWTISWKQSDSTLRIVDETSDNKFYDTYSITYLDEDTMILKMDGTTYSYQRVTKSQLPFSISDIEWDD